jgi:DNA (cytosine-5)-methyltransferase 1
MTVDGQLLEPQMLAHLTEESEFLFSPTLANPSASSLLPTPTAVQSRNATSGRQADSQHHAGTTLHDLVFDGSLLPTPKARDHAPEGYEAGLRRTQPQIGTVAKGIYDRDERILMPTPMTRDYKGDVAPHKRNGVVQTDTVERAIFHSGEIQLMGTPRATAAESSAVQVDLGAPKGRIEDQVLLTNWGKYEPAIRRWEQVLGRPAPAPTKPDGKGGSHRLSSEFTEWMMGLPSGWITGHGLKRIDELKMAGNGVVPQQAELALLTLLQGGSNE